MNTNLHRLHPYPFEKLAQLKKGLTTAADMDHIALSIGEPKHSPPLHVLNALKENMGDVSRYAGTKGTLALRQTISRWAQQRFHLKTIDANHNILPLNGTREGIFAFTQSLVDSDKENPTVLMPNPFYQIYEGATFLAGATPVFLDCTEHNDFLPDYTTISASVWQRCQLLFLCSPGNPTGKVMSSQQMQALIRLSDQYDFVIASDECYSELYFDQAPAGLLQACADMGRNDYKNCVVFHSLSKRSNLPGLRSGFIAGDADLIEQFLIYRTYHGCAMPLHVQQASIAAWNDEQHVVANRQLYTQKFSKVLDILHDVLDVNMPDAGFYLWPKTPIDDVVFAKNLYQAQNITLLPGSYLARESHSGNPGSHRARLALVATLDECVEAAERIKTFCQS